MTILKVNWIIPEEKGEFEVSFEDLGTTQEEWDETDADNRAFMLEDYMLERDLIAYANLDSYKEVNDQK